MRLFKIMDTAFDNFDRSIQTFLSKTLSNLGIEYTHSQLFGVVFDAMKGIMQNIMFYIEDALTEQNIFTATRKKSVYSLARLSGYEPYFGSAATGVILGKLNINNGIQSGTTKIYIQNGANILNTTTGITYSIMLPTDYYVFDVSKPLITHEFKIVQGVFATNTYVARGYMFETIHISNTGLWDRSYVTVSVDGVQYTEVANMYEMTENGNEYTLKTGFDNSFDITFGNNIFGHMLEEGQTVMIQYISHIGPLGNIIDTSRSNFVFTAMGTDSLNNTVNINDYMKLSISSPISGGTDSDSINFVRNMIGTNSRSLIFATEDNFRLFFRRFSFIGYVNCWSETNSMTVVASCLQSITPYINNVEDYYSVEPSSLLLTSTQKAMIQTTLDNSKRSFAGVTLKFQDPVIRKFAVICYVKIDNVYNKETVKSQIRTALASYFINTTNSTQFIAKSTLVTQCLNASSNIVALDMDIISNVAEETYYNGYYNRYELIMVNETYEYTVKKIMYERDNTPGLDNYGNISLDSKLEIPFLSGGFKYYPNKESYDKKTSFSVVDPVQIVFI